MNFKDELLFDNPWISLRKITHEKSEHGYIYSHESRCGGKIISILPFRTRYLDYGDDSREYLLRKETTPSWGPMPFLSTITGGVETGHPSEDAIRELKEEAGYDVGETKLWWLGTCRGAKSSDSEYFLFAVDLTNKIQGEALGDGSGLESEGSSEWVSEEQIAECVDPMAAVILTRIKKNNL